MRRETRTQDVITIKREHWDMLNWRVKKILSGNIKIIENDKEEVIEDGSESRDDL